jgi:hypothetical protein
MLPLVIVRENLHPVDLLNGVVVQQVRLDTIDNGTGGVGRSMRKSDTQKDVGIPSFLSPKSKVLPPIPLLFELVGEAALLPAVAAVSLLGPALHGGILSYR